MALQWNWKDKMGKLTIRQKGKKYSVNIYSGNALAIFICEYKQNDEERYVMYNFLADKKHCDNIIKNHKRLFLDEVVSIELNLYYRSAQTLLFVVFLDCVFESYLLVGYQCRQSMLNHADVHYS